MSWVVRVSTVAQRDIEEIIEWTAEHFGERQATTYARTLIAALQTLHEGPQVAGARERNEIGKGIHTLHVARHGCKGRHFVMFRVAVGPPDTFDVLRVLHDAMDLARHIPSGS